MPMRRRLPSMSQDSSRGAGAGGKGVRRVTPESSRVDADPNPPLGLLRRGLDRESRRAVCSTNVLLQRARSSRVVSNVIFSMLGCR